MISIDYRHQYKTIKLVVLDDKGGVVSELISDSYYPHKTVVHWSSNHTESGQAGMAILPAGRFDTDQIKEMVENEKFPEGSVVKLHQKPKLNIGVLIPKEPCITPLGGNN